MTKQADQKAGAQRAEELMGSGLDLRIDELVLHGFRPGDRYAIAAAVERELGRLFSEEGVPPSLAGPRADGTRGVFRVDAGSFDVAHDATPDAVGVQVARAVHRGLGAGGGESRTREAGSR